MASTLRCGWVQVPRAPTPRTVGRLLSRICVTIYPIHFDNPNFPHYVHFFKSIAGKKNKTQLFTHELVNDLGKEIKEMIFTRELLDKLG